MKYLSPSSKAKSIFAKFLDQHILTNDVEGFGALTDPEESERIRPKDQNKSPPGRDSPTEIVPLFTQTGTKQKSG